MSAVDKLRQAVTADDWVVLSAGEARELVALIDHLADQLRPSPSPCEVETHSWRHFTAEQVDSYWIRCTLQGPHDEHKDENTGLTWRGDA